MWDPCSVWTPGKKIIPIIAQWPEEYVVSFHRESANSEYSGYRDQSTESSSQVQWVKILMYQYNNSLFLGIFFSKCRVKKWDVEILCKMQKGKGLTFTEYWLSATLCNVTDVAEVCLSWFSAHHTLGEYPTIMLISKTHHPLFFLCRGRPAYTNALICY